MDGLDGGCGARTMYRRQQRRHRGPETQGFPQLTAEGQVPSEGGIMGMLGCSPQAAGSARWSSWVSVTRSRDGASAGVGTPAAVASALAISARIRKPRCVLVLT